MVTVDRPHPVRQTQTNCNTCTHTHPKTPTHKEKTSLKHLQPTTNLNSCSVISCQTQLCSKSWKELKAFCSKKKKKKTMHDINPNNRLS